MSNKQNKNQVPLTSPLRGPRFRRGMMVVVKPKNFKGTMKRLWNNFDKERILLLAIFFLVCISSGLGLLVPYLIGKAIDTIDLGINKVDLNMLLAIITILVGTYIIDGLISLIQSFIMAGISQRIVFNLRNNLFSKLQRLPLSYFDTNAHGDIMSRLTNDVENVSTTVSQSTIQLMSSFINIIGALIMMLVLSPIMTGVSMITIPMVFILTKSIAKKTKVLFKSQQEELGKLNAHIEESISGLEVIKAFNREEKIVNEFEDINSRLCEVGIKAQVISGFIMPLMNVINNFGFTAVAITGGILAVKGLINVGIIAVFLIYSRQFARPLIDLSNIFNALQSAVAGAERVFETLDEVEEAKDVEGAKELRDIRGEVVFNNVSFGYRDDTEVLKGISFKVKEGSTIALVGPTGAGKTTIVNLITRFYDITSGEILIDGIDIRNYTRDSLRRCFGIVLQDTYLFSGTIKENIKYGKIDATENEIVEAARMANAHYFISNLKGGYGTELLEGGTNLSQGQRQLIAIARAILSNPSILILDEATSSIDTRTELNIQEAMLKLMKGRTSFIIAHRLSTIKNADIIMVIDGGEIVESGSHKELMMKKGEYYNLHRSQFANTSLEN